MPDLLTHGCAGLLVGWLVAGRRPAPGVALFALGNVLPDLLCRLPGIVAGEFDSKIATLPRVLIYGWEPLHQPIGCALAAFGLSMLFAPGHRLRAGALLFTGMLGHILLDVMQFHEGAGIMLLYPVTTQPFEIGLYGSEDSVLVAGPLVVATGLVAWWRRKVLGSALGAPQGAAPPRQ